MKARLVDFLACPHDLHFPLNLRIFRQRPAPGTIAFERCEVHCGLLGAPSAKASKEDCKRCADTEVDEGVLLCEQCERWYAISGGIARLLPDDLRQGDENFIGRNFQEFADIGLVDPYRKRALGRDELPIDPGEIHKMQVERDARDEQAEKYDSMLSLKILRNFEVPAYYDALRGAPLGALLEAGCGTGRLTDVFRSVANEVICADFSLQSIRRNRVRHLADPLIHFLQCDLTRLPLRDECVTAIAHAGVYEHIPTRDARIRWLRHAERVMKPSGRFLISAYNFLGPTTLFGKQGEHPGGIPFVRFTEQEFRSEAGEVFDIKQFRANIGMYLLMAVCERRRNQSSTSTISSISTAELPGS